MTTTDPRQAIHQIELLRRLFPPDAIIHIGAGHGSDREWLKWQPQYSIVIDADPTRLNWAREETKNRPNWSVLEAVVGRSDGEATYHLASNRNEDGLIHPKELTPLWPNLRSIQTINKPLNRLDTLINGEVCGVLKSASCIWTKIECLPAVEILEGAGSELDRWSVLRIRVLLDTTSDSLLNATLSQAEAYLFPRGFKCLLIVSDHHPSVGEAVFVRDWKGTLSLQLRSQQGQFDQLAKDKDEQARLANDRHEKIQKLTQERDAAKNDLTEQKSLLDQAVQAKEAQDKLATERQKQLEQLTKELNAKTQLANDLHEEIQKLIQERDAVGNDLTEQKSLLDKTVKARDEQAKLAAESQTQLEQLTKELNEKNQLANDRHEEIQKLIQELDKATQSAADYHARLVQMNEEKDGLSSLASERLDRINELIKSLDERDQLVAKNLKRIDQLTTDRDEQAHWHQENAKWAKALDSEKKHLEEKILELTKNIEEKNKLITENIDRIEQISKDRDKHAHWHQENAILAKKLEEEKQSLLDKNAEFFSTIEEQQKLSCSLQDQKNKIEKDFKDLQKRTIELEKINIEYFRLANERISKIDHLEKVIVEKDQYNLQYDEELIKLEAQVELIKDILIREKS